MLPLKATIAEGKLQLLNETKYKFTTLMKHGTMIVEYYAPEKVDLQKPHRQDELYVIVSGSGNFIRNGDKITFQQGDVLFVPAGIEHHFEDFTDDFATWVIFYGKEGGEMEQLAENKTLL